MLILDWYVGLVHLQKLCRKLVHITVGLVYFLMWPLFR